MAEKKTLKWKVHVPKLFCEVLSNPTTGILQQPLHILSGILGEVAQRAIELNDPILHSLMIRLALYECADPASEEYDPDAIEAYLKAADELAAESE